MVAENCGVGSSFGCFGGMFRGSGFTKIPLGAAPSSIGPLRQFGFFMGTCITAAWQTLQTEFGFLLHDY